MTPLRTLITVTALLTLGCTPGTPRAPTAVPDNGILTERELLILGDHVPLYEIISRQRPGFLRTHRGRLLVFQGNILLGNAAVLRTILTGGITAVRFYNSLDAAQVFGSQAEGGPVLQLFQGVGPRPIGRL
ncbi:MAG: hypothetical protein ABR551_00035 [Gemmatimonadales bacterium]